MEPAKTINEQMASAEHLEKIDQPAQAAAIYQKIFHKDPNNQEAMGRLLVMYRKLKEYTSELAVLNKAIDDYNKTRRSAQDKWIQSHPKAARAGRSMLKQMEKGGDAVMGMGAAPMVERWIKRRDLVADMITGKKRRKIPKQAIAKSAAPVQKTKPDLQRKKNQADKQQREREKQREPEAAKHLPSLFVIILHYLVSLDKIDAAMKQHMAFLDKHYKNGDFLVSGRQVPRTGGIIIARATERSSVEKIVRQDPFVRRKLASADIIEFTASQHRKELQGWKI